jgi:hypothetical protein
MRQLIVGLFLIAVATTISAQTPTPDERAKEIAAELGRLEQERQLVEAQNKLLVLQAQLAASSATAEFAEIKARADAEKALLDADKARTDSELSRDFAVYEKLKGVDLSKIGKTGAYTIGNSSPPGLRAKAEAERALASALEEACKSEGSVSNALKDRSVLVDSDGTLLTSIATSLLVRRQLTAVQTDLDTLLKEDDKFGTMALAGSALAVIQGLNLLSQATQLFRSDTAVSAETTTFSDVTLGPLFELKCSVRILSRDGTVTSGTLDNALVEAVKLNLKLKQSLAAGRTRVATMNATVEALKSKSDQASVARREELIARIAQVQAVLEQADSLSRALTSQALADVVWAEHVQMQLNSARLVLVRISAVGEARNVLKTSAWSATKARAAGSATVRVTVRDGTGRLLATSAAYSDSEPTDITTVKAGVIQLWSGSGVRELE